MEPKCADETDNEDLTQYKKGGYHPVQTGDLFENRYQVLRKIGWGQFSTVWLCLDVMTKTHVALKISKSALFYSDAAASEMNTLLHIDEKIKSGLLLTPRSYIVSLLNTFTHRGPNGRHFVLVFEILGINLLEVIKIYEYKGMPLSMCKSFLIQILRGLDFLHRVCGIVHTDLKPENVAIQLTNSQVKELTSAGCVKTPLRRKVVGTEEIPRGLGRSQTVKKLKPAPKKPFLKKKVPQGKRPVNEDCYFNEKLQLKLVDFGNAVFIDSPCQNEIQTRQYRAPEVILGNKYSTQADMWSFACIAFELITGELLFQPHPGENFSEDEDHLASIWETVGGFPLDWALESKHGWKFFNKSGLIKLPDLQVYPLREILLSRYGFKQALAEDFSEFLLKTLQILPENRFSAEDCLKNHWLMTKKKY